jgi:hypothetical protein
MKKIIISLFLLLYAASMQAGALYNGMWFFPTSSDNKFQYADIFGLEQETTGEIVIPEKFTVEPGSEIANAFGPPYEWIVTGIMNGAFKYRADITAVSIPKSIVKIGDNAFQGCTGLTALYVSWTDPSTVTFGNDVFDGINKAAVKLHVPSGTKAAYQAADVWKDFNIVDDATSQTKTIHYVKSNGQGDGTSWSKASGSIQDMIDKAAVDDEVWVAAGTYYPAEQEKSDDVRTKRFRLRNGRHLYGGFAGMETSINDRAQSDRDGNGTVEPWEFSNETILSGDIDGVDGKAGNSYRVVVCPVEFTVETQFNGFTVKEGGVNPGTSLVASDGGGICAYGTLTISQCVVKDNSARSGSGIYNYGGTVEKSLVENNAYDAEMGGRIIGSIWGYGSGIYNSKGIIKNCIVRNNQLTIRNYSTGATGASAGGGGIYNGGGIVSNCLIYGNFAWASSYSGTVNYCGGIYNVNIISSGKECYGTIYNSTIVNNMGNSNVNNLTNSGNSLTYNTIDAQLLHNFVNPDANDFRLKPGSQYVDAGSTENIPDWIINGIDLAGNLRIHNGKIELGAYEYNGSQSGIKELQQTNVTVSFNLANQSVIFSGLQGSETLHFYNINGNQLFSREVMGESETVYVAHLPSGVYFVKVNNGQILKWVKK